MTSSLPTIGTNRTQGTGNPALKALQIALCLAAVVATIVSRRGSLAPRSTSAQKQPPEGSSHFDRFLQEATTVEEQSDSALGGECLFGLYTSWCFLNQSTPRSETAFWTAMRVRGIHPNRNQLRMKGPAAADYILASSPALVGR
jgi:hypothetical protein